MAFSTQFATSLELNKPLKSVISTTSKALLLWARELQNSGSDLITECDLAEVFGRCLIEEGFARNFRNAVQKSTVQKAVGIAEIVLEAGAGPTVSHSLDRAEFFRAVVQLSLLVWAYDTPSLASSLAKALEARGAAQSKSTPRYAALTGTLRSIHEQTAGFPWRPFLEAVTEVLKSKLGLGSYQLTRTISHCVLQSLLDALVAVQKLPEDRYLDIQTATGVPVLVVWIHYVLGLSLQVTCAEKVAKFGKGAPSVNISLVDDDEVALFNEHKDVIFHAMKDTLDDPVLEPACRFPIDGLGTKYVEGFASESIIESWNESGGVRCLAFDVIKGCIEDADRRRASMDTHVRSLHLPPSKERLLVTGRILFSQFDMTSQMLDSHILDTERKWHPFMVRDLKILINSLAVVRNLEDAKTATFNLRVFQLAAIETNSPGSRLFNREGLLTAQRAFETLAILISGNINLPISEAALASSAGWSLCLSTVFTIDPVGATPELYLRPGVPAKFGERKHLILDTASGVSADTLGLDLSATAYTVQGYPSDTVDLQSSLKDSPPKHMIATTEDSFKVFSTLRATLPQYFSTANIVNKTTQTPSTYIRLGFRYMQQLYWSSTTLPLSDCKHGFQATDQYTVPPSTWTFQGFFESRNPSTWAFDPWAAVSPYWREISEKQDVSKSNIQASESTTSTATNNLPDSPRPAPTTGSDSEPEHKTPYIHISATANSAALRWLLLTNARLLTQDKVTPQRWSSDRTKPQRFDAVYVRRGRCCVGCAVNAIRDVEEREEQGSKATSATGKHILLIM